MRLFVRTLLTWLLVLAVPVQGAAAATMAFCGPNHHGAGQAVMVEVDHVHHDGAGSERDHHHAQEAHDEDVSASPQSAPHAKFVHADKHKCSACASCCAAAALPSASVALEPPLLGDSFLPLISRSVVSLVADGLERPPRFVLS